jgi:hypothetical protein
MLNWILCVVVIGVGVVSGIVVDETIDDLPSCELPTSARGRVIVLSPSEVGDFLALITNNTPSASVNGGLRIAPGDEIHLKAGAYDLTRQVSMRLSGTRAAPIVVRTAPLESSRAVIRRYATNQNLLDGVVAWTFWHNLEFRGGSAGVRLQGETHHNVWDECEFSRSVDVVFRANDAGSDVHHNIVQRSYLHDALGPGTAEIMYLGCHPGDCQFRFNLIRNNLIHGVANATAAGISQGDCVEIKRGSFGNVVSDNVIHTCQYPGVFVYGKTGAARNYVLRNVISGVGDNAIQVTSDAVIVGNVIGPAGGSGVAVQANSGMPENVLIAHNTIVDNAPIRFSGTAGRTGFVVEDNLLLGGGVVNGNGAEVVIQNNAGTTPGKGVVATSLPAPSTIIGADLHPTATTLAATGVLQKDIACKSGSYVGALQTLRDAPGNWRIVNDFKPDCNPCAATMAVTTATGTSGTGPTATTTMIGGITESAGTSTSAATGTDLSTSAQTDSDDTPAPAPASSAGYTTTGSMLMIALLPLLL